MMHIKPAIPEWEELEEYLNQRDHQHGHEIALTDHGMRCVAMDGKELCLVKWQKAPRFKIEPYYLPEDLRKVLRLLAEPDANDFVPYDEDFPNIIYLNIAEPTLGLSIAGMKQALRLLDYGWILAEPQYAPYIWGEKEWPEDVFAQDIKDDLEYFYSDNYFLYQQIVNGEKLPKIDWESMTHGEKWLKWRWADVLAKRPDFAEFCPWEKLSPHGWANILEQSPQFADRCDWSIFNNSEESFLQQILSVQPQLLKFCKKSRLSCEDWAWILRKQPQLADECDFSKFNGNAWGILLNKQPQFADKCNWQKLKSENYDDIFSDIACNTYINDELLKLADMSKFSAKIWSLVLCVHPELGGQCHCFDKMRDYELRQLLCVQPQFSDQCNWSRLSGETMFRIVQKHPQLAMYCDFSKMKERELCLLIFDYPSLESLIRFSLNKNNKKH